MGKCPTAAVDGSKFQRFIPKIKQSISQSFRMMMFILRLFKDCCSSKASCFTLISAEVIFARVLAPWKYLDVVEVLLKLNLTELNPLELNS